MKVPYNVPYVAGREYKYIVDAVNRQQISGDGYYTKKINQFIEKTFHTKKALMTTSCTVALDMAGILLDLQADDEVILPSYTFASTANAIMLRGATPVFAEICEDTLNIDPAAVESRVNSRTKAIFPVHYGGVGCRMDEIMQIARKYGLKVVEDAAQGVNARYKDRYLGTIGDIGCYSFHETKNYSCGEGGAILINSEDKRLMERAEIIREKGTDRSKFFRGEVDKYSWVDIGSSYLPSDMLAAFLYAQFEVLESILEKRKKAFLFYDQELKPLESKGMLKLPVIPGDCTSNYHLFYLIFNTAAERERVMDYLKERGIMAIFHYVPLHTAPMGKKLGYKMGDFPITESISARLLRLPLYPDITEAELSYVTGNIYKALGL